MICCCIVWRVFFGYVRWIVCMLVGIFWIGVFGEVGLDSICLEVVVGIEIVRGNVWVCSFSVE